MRTEPLTPKELARELKVSTRLVHNMARAGSIPYYKAGKVRRYSLPDVLKALEHTPKPQPKGE